MAINSSSKAGERTHTPGPWRRSGDAAFTTDGWLVAEACFLRSGSETGANANLITAAPELLAACHAFYDACDDVRGIDLPRSMRNAMGAVYTAIMKAEGRSE